MAAVVPPTLVGEFKSSSGRAILQYYSYTVTTGGTFRGGISVPTGFDQVEVLLTGFTLTTDSHEAPIQQGAVSVQKFLYDALTGDLEIGVSVQFVTDGQGQDAEVTFVVILTDAAAAHFTRISTGCVGTAECNITRLLAGAVPAGMRYVGLGTQIWNLGSRSGAVPLNGIAGHENAISVNPPHVWVDFIGALRDGAWQNDIFLEWQAVVVAFDPSEMTQAPSSLPNQYTFLGTNLVTRQSFSNQASSPSGAPVRGFLDALDGFILLFSQSINGPEYPIWMIEASASAPILAPNGALTTYGAFLGTRFGDTVNTAPYFMQISRVAGFLH